MAAQMEKAVMQNTAAGVVQAEWEQGETMTPAAEVLCMVQAVVVLEVVLGITGGAELAERGVRIHTVEAVLKGNEMAVMLA